MKFSESEISIEVWKPVNIDGFSHLYEVSDLGRVRRLSDSGYRGSWKAGKFLTLHKHNKFGHLKVDLYCDTKVKRVWVHRLVLLTFIGDPPTVKHEVAHYDGDASNNRLCNLRWATSKENKEDNRRNNTMIVGSKHCKAKLSEGAIPEIFRLYRYGATQKELGCMFGVHANTIGKILLKKRWKHVEVAYG